MVVSEALTAQPEHQRAQSGQGKETFRVSPLTPGKSAKTAVMIFGATTASWPVSPTLAALASYTCFRVPRASCFATDDDKQQYQLEHMPRQEAVFQTVKELREEVEQFKEAIAAMPKLSDRCG
jgi:hypothetical protein